MQTVVGYCEKCGKEVMITGTSYNYGDGQHSASCSGCGELYRFKVKNGCIVPKGVVYAQQDNPIQG